MRIIKSILMTGFNGLLLFVLLFTLGRPGDLYFNAGNEYFFSRGNASVSVRSEIMQQLHDFQDGYTGRDLSQAESFAARLFSPDDIVILGTMGTGSVEWDYDVDEVSIPRRALRAMESAATSSISSHNRLFSKNPTQL
ncbi:MAG: hypothetical protein GY832_33080, partial [Chloroflexi bacterium]|nr:hypothetical protein [Chloroflexota bacterium]